MTVEEALAIIRTLVAPQRLSQTQETVFRQSWEGQSYQEIADNSGYAHGYVRDVGSELWQLLSETFGKKVTKKNFQLLLKQHRDSLCITDLQPLKIVADKGITAVETSVNQFQSWGEAVNVSIFHGRTEELTTLKQWIVQDCCQLVAVFGMGGIGKTTLAVKLAQQIQGEFKYLIWRSLRNAPLVLDLLAELVQFLAKQRETALPETVDGRVLRLLEYLRSCRCLLVLDNAETILNSGDRTGCYREGYEGYGQLFRCVAETIHQSCLVLTSREQPRGWVAKSGEPLPVRSLQLTSLPTVTAREFLQCRVEFQASEEEWKFLTEHYGGNPLALRMVAPVIRDLFDSSISKFLELLKQGTLVFDDIRNLLERQFNRLSDIEKEVMYWLAINREPITFPELQADFVSTARQSEILEALGSLQRRSLIERSLTGFTQQPAVMEYVIERLIEQVCQEIITGSIDLLISHALIKAQAKDYIRVSQIRIILEPLLARLKDKFRSIKHIEDKLKQLLLVMQVNFSNSPGYGAGNLINILHQCHVDLSSYNFSELTIWQAYLQDVNLHNVNFTNADLARSVFAQTLGGIFSVAFSPDGKLLATGDTLGKLCLWRVSDGIQLWTGLGHTSWIRSVTFSPDGAKLASGSLDQTVRLWNVRTGKCSNTLQTNNKGVLSISFSSNGCFLATGSVDKMVRIWDMRTNQCIQTLEGHTDRVLSVAFSPDSAILASGSADRTIRLWHSDGKCCKILQEHEGEIWSIAFSRSGIVLASGSSDRTIKLWHVVDGACQKTLPGHTDVVHAVAFGPDGQTLASGSADCCIKLWNIATGKCTETWPCHTGRVLSVTFSPNDHMLVSGSDDQTVKLWSLRTGQVLRTWAGHAAIVSPVAFSPQRSAIGNAPAAKKQAQGERTIKLWEVNSGEPLMTLQLPVPYEGMNITGVTGLTEAHKATLKALGAVEFEVN